MHAVAKNLKWLDKNGKGIFWSLTCMVFFVTSLYVYFVNTAAHNGARMGKAEQESVSLGAAISEYESRYLSLKKSVTLALAYARGFEDVKTIRFLKAEKVGVVATAKDI